MTTRVDVELDAVALIRAVQRGDSEAVHLLTSQPSAPNVAAAIAVILCGWAERTGTERELALDLDAVTASYLAEFDTEHDK